MSEIILEALERTKQTGKFRENGYVAGVIYGDSVEGATSVKFEEKALSKILANHGSNIKLWININNTKKYGFIREVQRQPMSRQVTHVDVQIVSKDHEIKLLIPIVYKGEDTLKNRQLQLQVNKHDILVFGKMDIIPESVVVDVSEMNLGDTIHLKDLGFNKLLKIENEDEVYATINNLRVQLAEAIETEEETETK